MTYLPADVDDLAELYEAHPEATIVAGSTDVGLWVTKHLRDIAPVILIGHLDGLKQISLDENGLTLGAGVSYTAARGALVAAYPQMAELWDRIGGEQVRNMGTIGGNIAKRLADRRHAAAADRARRDRDAAQGQRAPHHPARSLLHRLWQAGPGAGRVRRERVRACAGGGCLLRRLQDLQAPRRGHFGALRGRSG